MQTKIAELYKKLDPTKRMIVQTMTREYLKYAERKFYENGGSKEVAIEAFRPKKGEDPIERGAALILSFMLHETDYVRLRIEHNDDDIITGINVELQDQGKAG